jgi:6-phosphogluconate dehydrogenase
MNNNLQALRDILQIALQAHIPTPALSAARNYLDSIFNPSLPANLLQAQRDYFGAHTYQRNDRSGTFHTEWYHEA